MGLGRDVAWRSPEFWGPIGPLNGRRTASLVLGTPYICRLEDYGCDEFCVVLEGSVTMIDDDGHGETFPAGDSFLIPKGFTGYWKQSEKIEKFFMTVCYG